MTLSIKISLIFITLLAGFYLPDVIKHMKNYLDNSIQVRSIDHYCMLSAQACIQGSTVITLDRDILQPMVSSKINVLWSNNLSPKLTLTMKGLEGRLGIVKYTLKPIGNNVYEGEILLPVCTLNEMTWLGELTDGTTIVYPALRMKS